MPKPAGLQQRHKTWYVRVRVPKDLVESYKSKEIIRSLETRDYSEACRRIHIERVKIESEFHEQRQRNKTKNMDMLAGCSEHDLEGLSLRWLEEVEKKLRNAEIKNNKDYSEDEKQDFYKDLQDEVWRAKKEATGDSEDVAHYGVTAAAKFLDRLGITYSRGSEVFRKLGNLFSMAVYERAQRDLRYLEGKPFAPTHPIFQKSFQMVQNNQAATSSRRITFKQLTEEYMKDPSVKRVQSTKTNYRIIFRAFEEFLGSDKYIDEITRQECRRLQDLISRIPTNATKKAPQQSLLEASNRAEQEGWALISPATVNSHLSKLSAVLDYAVVEGYLAANPSKGLSIYDPVRKKDKKLPFDIEQLNKIFAAPLYTGCIDDGHGYNKTGDKRPRGARFWIPIISLWTGMRLNEICQLEVTDIIVEDNIDMILIREISETGQEKKLKTEASIRAIPLHPELKKIGFLQYLEDMRDKKNIKIFPDLTQGSTEYHSNNVSKWFGHFLKNIKAKKPKTSFHSFRHCYKDAVDEAEIPEAAKHQLGGWARRQGTSDDYGRGLKPSTLYKHICKIKYDGLDLSHLYIEN